MSKFVTKIPVNIEEVLKLLPVKSDVQETRLSEDGKTIEIEWSNDWMQTPYTVPHEWPLETFWAKTLPDKVVDKMAVKSIQLPSPAPESKEKVDKPAKKNDKGK